MSALLLVDVQYDFIDGSLAVKDAQDILPVVYDLIEKDVWDLVVASQDYHPKGHISFASTHNLDPFQPIQIRHPITTQNPTQNPCELRQEFNSTATESVEAIEQMLWPDHCVQGTRGCEIEEGVRARLDKLSDKAMVIQKGYHPLVDSYSAFAMNTYVQFTELPRILFSRGIKRVTIVGLATDYCVRATAIDARKFLLDVTVVRAGVRAVDSSRAEAVLNELSKWGCTIV